MLIIRRLLGGTAGCSKSMPPGRVEHEHDLLLGTAPDGTGEGG
jgi:hypothetical protein